MMTQLDLFIEQIESNVKIKNTSFVVEETPLAFFNPEETIEFHASRLLFLLRYCATDKLDDDRLSIKGRTKLAKLDFFLRYPLYLEKALKQPEFHQANLTIPLEAYERQSIEASMIRYKYAPWDNKYYDVWAYLLAKDLMVIKINNGVDHFLITERGEIAVDSLLELETYEVLKQRCQVMNQSLAKQEGTWLKDFIYRHFPDIVGMAISSTIKGVYDV